MKHLEPEQIAAYADGLRPEGEDARHLRACRDCQGELRALRSLTRTLAETPAPPAALRQATLERLGLRPAHRGLQTAGLRWAAFLVGALVLAWILPLPSPWQTQPQGPRPSALALDPVHASALAVASARENLALLSGQPGPKRGDRLRPRTSSVSRRLGTELARTTSDPHASLPGAWVPAQTPKVAVQENEAVGGVAPQETSGTGKSVDAPLGQVPSLTLDSIRGNLIRPGQGQALSFTLRLGSEGPLRVLVADRQGRRVATLYEGTFGPGSLTLSWNGAAAPSGTYTVLIQAGGQSKSFNALVVR